MNSLFIFIENLRDTILHAREPYILTEQEETELLDKFDNKWLYLKAVQEVSDRYKLSEKDKEDVAKNRCVIDEFAFSFIVNTEGSLQIYYVLVFLKLRYPIIEDRVDKIIEKMVM